MFLRLARDVKLARNGLWCAKKRRNLESAWYLAARFFAQTVHFVNVLFHKRHNRAVVDAAGDELGAVVDLAHKDNVIGVCVNPGLVSDQRQRNQKVIHFTSPKFGSASGWYQSGAPSQQRPILQRWKLLAGNRSTRNRSR